MMSLSLPDVDPRPAAFQSLVARSIAAWRSIRFATKNREELIEKYSAMLPKLKSIDDLLGANPKYWFFQTRENFMSQTALAKWDSDCLERYIVLPVDCGFANNTDCFFISHYWRTPSHPDPDGIDLSLLRQDLEGQEWSYVWLDWTCLPQVPRSQAEERYFRQMLQCIPLVVQDCAFVWRYPEFEPRAWVLFEIAVFLLNHHYCDSPTEDMKPFALHIKKMVESTGVIPTLKEYGYRCADDSDLTLVTGWLEILVILHKAVPDVLLRQEILDHIHNPSVGSFSNPFSGLGVDKSAGTITLNGTTHKFTPVFGLYSD